MIDQHATKSPTIPNILKYQEKEEIYLKKLPLPQAGYTSLVTYWPFRDSAVFALICMNDIQKAKKQDDKDLMQ